MKLAKAITASFIALGASSTWAETVRELHVFLPDNATWNTSTPLIYEDGKAHELTPDSNYCGWFTRRYVDEKLPQKAFFYMEGDDQFKYAIGMDGEAGYQNNEPAYPIDIDALFQFYSSEADFQNKLYFVTDKRQAEMLPSSFAGWYVDRPDIKGRCSYILATMIYDTDASLHPAFSCYAAGGEGCQAVSGTAAQGVEAETAIKAIYDCIGVTTGLVEDTLDKATKKPKLSAAGKKCFIDEKYFNQLFNYTEGVNETSCFDIPFIRTNKGWDFNSDEFVVPGLKTAVTGGFFPVEATTDDVIKLANASQKPLPAARTKRNAEGPIFYGTKLRELDPTEQIPLINTICNGPGWDKGHDCNGMFADAAETETFIKSINSTIDCVFGWSCPEQAPTNWPIYTEGTETPGGIGINGVPRWTSNVSSENGGRNHHFCTETHAQFKYKKGARFSISGNDDIWVFIDNKLAVDIGGNHLSAPGYVDVDKFLPNAKQDSIYDIDIFTCNRRAPSSDLRISTNMLYMDQNAGISLESKQNMDEWRRTGNNEYKVCYTQNHNGSCVPQITVCDTADFPITKKPKISFLFTTDPTGKDPTKTLISEEEFAANPIQLDSIFDVSNPTRPIVKEKRLTESLAPGMYYLIIKIDDEQTAISFAAKSEASIAERRVALSSTSAFSVMKSGAQEITITTEKPSLAKRFAVMDMNGQVLSAGKLNSIDTRVKVPTAGSYIVKVGNNTKRVNVR